MEGKARRPDAAAPPGGTEPAARDLAPGEKLGRYAILESVGRGAMGVVYGAYDPELDRKIALKVINPERGKNPVAPARLVREAKAMARLAHPNVIAIHDVGLVEGQVFLAMEFLGGGTLRSWLDEKPRTWREVLDLFIAAGRGLAAAHGAGLVHRDFKPDNVLLDKEGRPRVVDFGLARERGGADDEERKTARLAVSELTATGRASTGHLETLTRTGALVGTPAYMAPEQFLGEPADERSDQFSFCIALYEALYGERPFAGDNVLSLSLSVTSGQVRPVPKDRVVPAWIRRVVARGLLSKPAERYPSMAALIAALEDDPAARRRRRLITGGVVGVVVASLLVAGFTVRRRRQEVERQIAAHAQEGNRQAAQASRLAGELRVARAQAFAAFQARERERGEKLWRQSLARVGAVRGAYERSAQALERALVLDGGRHEIRGRLADVRVEHLLLDEELRLEREASALQARLASDDTDGSRRRALAAPATLVVRPTPAGAALTLARYQRDASGRRALVPAGKVTAGAPIALPPGSYRLVLNAPGHAEVVFPFELARQESRTLELALPAAAAVPEGFAYIPAGDFWFGDADEKLRTDFLDTAPLHRRSTGAYLIARRETTYREWIAFLDALPAAERAAHAPDVSTSLRGSLKLQRAGGAWQLTFQPTSQRYTARASEPFTYVGRTRRAQQSWLDFPVAGISPADVERFLAWQRQTGKVPGARLCTENEWERAARGADARVYPHGDELRADDANFDVTYGRIDSAFGPDAVGSHPESQSPFGLDDLAGNVLEFTRSTLDDGGPVIRGGAYYFNAATCRATNRNSVPASFRDVTTGVRICASTEGTDDVKDQKK